ncbi:MAG: RHS repeat-associated core domain-containing protein, partial [Chthoniobacterales bacterium]
CIIQSGDDGRIQVQYDYDAFGFPYVYNAAGGKGNAQTRFLFTGREWISDLRLYDFRARLYQPELGRFLQPDPQEFAAGDYNLYRYCHNDPVNLSDPTGLREQIAGDIIWDMARYMDSANTSQGSFADFTNGAYMGASGGGGAWGGDGGRRYSFAQFSENNGARPAYVGARAKIEHDESFDLSQDPITLDSGARANAKTSVKLGDPHAEVGSNGNIHFTQVMTSKTTFPVPNTEAIVTAEWKRVEEVREERRVLQMVAETKALRSFASAAQAEKIIGAATRRQFTLWFESMKTKYDAFNKDGGTK